MKIKTPTNTLVILSVFIVMFLAACDADSPSLMEKESLSRPAKLLVVGQIQDSKFLNFPAVIESQKLSSLSFEASGVVKEVLVVEAQRVEQGEVLALLDQRDLQANLKSARAQFDNAETEYNRAVRLIAEDAISRSELEQRKSQMDVNRSQLETAEKALQGSVLVAPYSGNVASVSIREQQAVQGGESAIEILGGAGLEASINLPSSIMAKSKMRNVTREASYLTLSAAPDRRIPAQFKGASLSADAASQTYKVIFTFKAPDDLNILPGMNASLWFRDPSSSISKEPKVRIPLTAIAADGEQKYVWVVNTEVMTATRRNITLESDIGTNLNVTSGLNLGETIVSAGVASVTEGMHIRPWAQ